MTFRPGSEGSAAVTGLPLVIRKPLADSVLLLEGRGERLRARRDLGALGRFRPPQLGLSNRTKA
jgi:hypothetical protein